MGELAVFTDVIGVSLTELVCSALETIDDDKVTLAVEFAEVEEGA